MYLFIAFIISHRRSSRRDSIEGERDSNTKTGGRSFRRSYTIFLILNHLRIPRDAWMPLRGEWENIVFHVDFVDFVARWIFNLDTLRQGISFPYAVWVKKVLKHSPWISFMFAMYVSYKTVWNFISIAMRRDRHDYIDRRKQFENLIEIIHEMQNLPTMKL